MSCGTCHDWIPFEDNGGSGITGPAPDFKCKHCLAVADECESCEGTGFTDWDEEESGLIDDMEDGICDECEGIGVIKRKGAGCDR